MTFLPPHAVARVVLILLIGLGCGVLVTPESFADTGCCKGQIGNVDQSVDERMDVGDLALLVDYLFISLAPLPCPEEANLDQSPDGVIDITDLTLMVEHLFITLEPEPSCVDFPNFVPDYIRLRVMHSAESVFKAIDWSNLTTGNLAMRSYLRSLPEILASDTLGDAVWAQYTDSVVHIFSHNFDVGTTPTMPFALREPAQSNPRTMVRKLVDPRTLSHLGGYELPTSTTVRLIKTVGSGFPGIENELKGWFTAQGYTVQQTSGSVEDFKTIVGEGFLYFHGHGDEGVSPDGTSLYALWTSTPSDGANPPSARAADLKAHRLVIYTAPDALDPNTQAVISKSHYAITGKFVTAYWGDLADYSMVWINACSSGGPLGASFADAVLARNAGLYFGWTSPVRSNNALFVTELMVDWMLGMNVAGSPPDPPNRPFDYNVCYDHLVSINQNFQPGGNSTSEFVSIVGNPKAGILRPSIEVVNVHQIDEIAATADYMTGQFGSNESSAGEVTVDGELVSSDLWSPGVVAFRVPSEGAGSAGNVQVRIPNQSGGGYRTSNNVPISRWTIPFTYSHEESGLRIDVTCDMTIREDVHPFRIEPNGDLFKSIVIGVNTKRKSPVTFAASGSNSQTVTPDFIINNSWSGSCNEILSDAGGDAFYVAGTNNIDLIHKTLNFYLAVAMKCGKEHIHETFTGLPPYDTTIDILWGLEDELPDNQDDKSYTVNLSDSYEIVGGTRSTNSNITVYGFYINPPSCISKLSWPTVAPEFPPDNNTEAINSHPQITDTSTVQFLNSPSVASSIRRR